MISQIFCYCIVVTENYTFFNDLTQIVVIQRLIEDLLPNIHTPTYYIINYVNFKVIRIHFFIKMATKFIYQSKNAVCYEIK